MWILLCSAMQQLLLWIGLFELVSLPALYETLNGGERAPGDFYFDPLGRECQISAFFSGLCWTFAFKCQTIFQEPD